MTPPAPFAPAALKLLQGVLYHSDPQWKVLQEQEAPLREWLAQVGLTVEVWEADGFAVLRQSEGEGEGALPRLMQRRPLSLPATLLCVILRDRLARHDAAGTDAPRLILTHEDLRDEFRPFFPPQSDEVRVNKRLSNAIGTARTMGLLQDLAGAPSAAPAYEVRRLVRALVDADQLAAIRNALREHLSQGDDETDAATDA